MKLKKLKILLVAIGFSLFGFNIFFISAMEKSSEQISEKEIKIKNEIELLENERNDFLENFKKENEKAKDLKEKLDEFLKKRTYYELKIKFLNDNIKETEEDLKKDFNLNYEEKFEKIINEIKNIIEDFIKKREKISKKHEDELKKEGLWLDDDVDEYLFQPDESELLYKINMKEFEKRSKLIKKMEKFVDVFFYFLNLKLKNLKIKYIKNSDIDIEKFNLIINELDKFKKILKNRYVNFIKKLLLFKANKKTFKKDDYIYFIKLFLNYKIEFLKENLELSFNKLKKHKNNSETFLNNTKKEIENYNSLLCEYEKKIKTLNEKIQWLEKAIKS